MVKQYLHSAILLFFAWNIYSRCQHEIMLPLIAGGILIVSLAARFDTTEKQFKLFARLPLFAVILLSLAIGYFFRSAFPLPEDALTPFPALTAAAQSATIIATVFLWLKPFNRSNFYLILFMAWLTVTLSMDVPYSRDLFLNFSVFSLLSIVVVILNNSHRPTERKYIFRYYRNFTFFSIILVALTIVLFFVVSTSVMVFDRAFMSLMKDYILPRSYTHFLNIDPQLSLISPGASAFDKRPVLEVSVPQAQMVYLKTQIFKDFSSGIWKEPENMEYTPVAKRLVPDHMPIHLMMFTLFKDIVPSPASVTGIQAPGLYKKDAGGVIHGEEERPAHILTFSVDDKLFPPVELSASEFLRYTDVPADIAPDLKRISSAIVGEETDPLKKALRIQDFFNNNFDYSLEVNFRADNKGLIAMIEERRPAYCTYFATAMSLLLRSEGIPARLVTGFLTDEVIDKQENRFLARVKNAHAWVGALVPVDDPFTQHKVTTWIRFDPTPPSAVSTVAGKRVFFDIDRYAEKIYLGILRFSAHVQNIDREKAKKNALLGLAFFLFLMNAKGIFLSLKRGLAQNRSKPPTIKPPAHLQLIYKRYEQYLKRSFDEARRITETDQDVVDRLKARPEIPPESVAKVESFVQHYHAARFGEKQDERLEEMLK